MKLKNTDKQLQKNYDELLVRIEKTPDEELKNTLKLLTLICIKQNNRISLLELRSRLKGQFYKTNVWILNILILALLLIPLLDKG